MDTDTTLDQILSLTRSIHADQADEYDMHQLAALIESLDSWIGAGGHLPLRWSFPNTTGDSK